MSKKKQKQQRTGPHVAVASPERTAGIVEYRVEEGVARVTLSAPLPAPTMAENRKWPWGKWQTDYVQKQLQKDGLRVVQTVANLEHVRAVVASREAERASRRAEQPQQRAAAEAAGSVQ